MWAFAWGIVGVLVSVPPQLQPAYYYHSRAWQSGAEPTVHIGVTMHLEQASLACLGECTIEFLSDDHQSHTVWIRKKWQRLAGKSHFRLLISKLATDPCQMAISLDGQRLGTTRLVVRITPQMALANTLIEVAQVRFGQGFSWAGAANRRYRGSMVLLFGRDRKLVLINELPTEQWLQGVVPAEMFASAPLPALQAQAVAARSLMLAQKHVRHPQDPFDLCSEQHCQVYAGYNWEKPQSNLAIRTTRGQVLWAEQRLVNAVYSANCGGFGEDNQVVWSQKPDRVLRGKPDFLPDNPLITTFWPGLNGGQLQSFFAHVPQSFCGLANKGSSRKSLWQRHFTRIEIQKMLQSRYPHLGTLKALEPVLRGRGGRITRLKLVGSKQTVWVQGELTIRKLFGNLQSAAFSITHHHNLLGGLSAVTLHGRGWGHGVGLCQLGAIGRAEAGQSYQAILQHYYSQAELRAVYR